jgi:hypothetical protein
LLASADVSCYQGQTVTFYVDSVVAGSSTTGSDGKVSLTIPLATNETYDITVEFGGTAACLASSASGTVTVAPSASVASGGGWYLPNGSEDRAQFGFVANRKYNKKTGKYVVSGELEWRFEKAARLKSAAVTQIGYTTITGYTKCALVSGTAELQLWDSSTSTWLSPSVVNFVATACDGGTGRKGGKKYDKPDAFGVSIIGQTVPGESGAIRLGGGSIKVN